MAQLSFEEARRYVEKKGLNMVAQKAVQFRCEATKAKKNLVVEIGQVFTIQTHELDSDMAIQDIVDLVTRGVLVPFLDIDDAKELGRELRQKVKDAEAAEATRVASEAGNVQGLVLSLQKTIELRDKQIFDIVEKMGELTGRINSLVHDLGGQTEVEKLSIDNDSKQSKKKTGRKSKTAADDEVVK